MKAIPRALEIMADSAEMYLRAVGRSSFKLTNTMIPATPARSSCTVSSVMYEEKNTAKRRAAMGSHNPDNMLYLKASQREPVEWKMGDATAMPSGMLCAPIARAMGKPTSRPFIHAK